MPIRAHGPVVPFRRPHAAWSLDIHQGPFPDIHQQLLYDMRNHKTSVKCYTFYRPNAGAMSTQGHQKASQVGSCAAAGARACQRPALGFPPLPTARH